MDCGITLYFCTGRKPLNFCEQNIYVAEYLCIQAAIDCEIEPISRHLFALWHPLQKIWYPSCSKFDISGGKKWHLQFRLRFKPPSIKRLKEQTDCNTFSYYFDQVRNDFLEGKIPELFNRNCRDKALGLVAADIIRQMLELGSSPDTMKYNSRDFLPQELKRSPIWDNFLKDPLQKAVSRGWINSKKNVQYVKEKYLQQLSQLVPEYGSENFSAQVDENGNVWEVTLAVDPYHSSQPGLRMRVQKSKGVWTHICSIEDLCYISMRKDQTVEISRQNGVPQYLKFQARDQMHSFVSALDGYYRLMEKWTFNLCKDLTTPSLLELKVLKCHGPVGYFFAYQKLQEKCNSEVGCYILRESASAYNEYRLDICYPSEVGDESKVQTLKIEKDEDEQYSLQGYEMVFPSIPQLLTYCGKIGELKLKRCIPPSEYDKTRLLLCRQENQDNHPAITRGECSCSAQCIPHDAVVFSKHHDDLFHGHLTTVYHAHLKRSNGEIRDIAVKVLHKEYENTHLQEFLSQCDKVLFWQHDALVSTVGMILSHPTALVMEYLPLGTLDLYLQEYSNELKEVDLVEAAYHLSRALWYLEEQRCCHGKIRCHNLLVAYHSENSFKIKLVDPGIFVYTDADLPWLPAECCDDYSHASRSPSADVFAFGTTLWQIFSYGKQPVLNKSAMEVKEWYHKNNHLDYPPKLNSDIQNLIRDCWMYDPDRRRRPQAIVRDVNQILYEVYNSRRNHSYATIYPQNTPINQNSSSIKPPLLPPSRPPKEEKTNDKNSIFKNVLPLRISSISNRNFSYNALTPSAYSASSEQSTCTVLTDMEKDSTVPVGSLASLCDSDTEPTTDHTNLNSSDLTWVIDKEQLNIKGTLGQGFYGEVKKAILTHYSGLTIEDVAVKRIKMSNHPAECFTDLKREIEIMKNLRHANIVEIKGLVEEPETMLIMEYLELGSLLSYLQLHKDRLGCSRLLKFASDVAQGMEYLEQKHIVHRDLAARNILVASEDHVKISDFGLAQFTEDHYYRMRTERNLPIRWYALESITEGKFSHKSDVWSYGITLWEMFSYGENPEIPGVPDTALNEALQQGQRLGIPLNCPSHVYELMRSCWELNSHERPTFTEILRKVTDLRDQLCS